jgi:hypothetical protein
MLRQVHKPACTPQPDGKQVLKFFREARPMQNYLKFCATSRRQVSTGLVGDYFVVAFSF